MVSTFATFMVAFVLRPGRGDRAGRACGDRAGRRAALVVIIGLMVTATGMTGLILTHARIGSGRRCCTATFSSNMLPWASEESQEAGSSSAAREVAGFVWTAFRFR